MSAEHEDNLPVKPESLPAISDDMIKNMGVTGNNIELVRNYFEKTRYHPVYDLILECKGHACRYYSKCILGKVNSLPTFGADCPIEAGLIFVWTEQLVASLKANPMDIVDQSQIREMVALYVFKRRAFIGHLAKDHMVIDVLKNVAFDGTSISEEQLHPILRQLEINHKTIMNIRKSMVATREAKAKAGSQVVDENMKKLGELMSRVKDAKVVEAKVINIKQPKRINGPGNQSSSN